jgi:hypothetical protein
MRAGKRIAWFLIGLGISLTIGWIIVGLLLF